MGSNSALRSRGAARLLAALLMSTLLAASSLAIAGCSEKSSGSSSSSSVQTYPSGSSGSDVVYSDTIMISVCVDPTGGASVIDTSTFGGFDTPMHLELESGSTAFDALANMGIAYEGSKNYVSSIGGLAEGAIPQAGWMYKVDGQVNMAPAGDFVLHDGDAVVWYYGTWDES